MNHGTFGRTTTVGSAAHHRSLWIFCHSSSFGPFEGALRNWSCFNAVWSGPCCLRRRMNLLLSWVIESMKYFSCSGDARSYHLCLPERYSNLAAMSVRRPELPKLWCYFAIIDWQLCLLFLWSFIILQVSFLLGIQKCLSLHFLLQYFHSCF